MNKKTACVIIAAAVQLLAISPSFATPVTYDLTATLYGGGTVTGNFTMDGGAMTGFDFTLPNILPFPLSEITSSTPNTTANYLGAFSQIQIVNYVFGSPIYETVFNLELPSLPTDSTPAVLDADSGSLLQGQYGNQNWDFVGFLESGTISLENPISAVPEPATLPLFAGGLGLLGLVAMRRKRRAAASIA